MRRIGHGGTLGPRRQRCAAHPWWAGPRACPVFSLDYDKTYVAELTLRDRHQQLRMPADETHAPEHPTSPVSPPRARRRAGLLPVAPFGRRPPWPPRCGWGASGSTSLSARAFACGQAADPGRFTIHSINIMAIWHERETLAFGTRVLLRISCSKGTYIRTLCHDIGEKLGVGAHMSFSSPG
jgi:tRNA pseudouridine55 synthase